MTELKYLVSKNTHKAFGKRGFAEGRLLLEWSKIVGNEIAQYCVPQKLARDRHGRGAAVLHLDVLPAFVLEIQQMEPVLLETISTYAGYRAVDRIMLHQTHTLPTAPETQHVPEPSAEDIAYASAQTEAVGDDALKAALTRLGARIHQKEETLEKHHDAP